MSCTSQRSPPSAVCRMTPSWPTAQPSLSSTKNTEVRSALTGNCDCFQVAPPSAEVSTCPRCPTATSRFPAFVTFCRRLRLASGDICAGASSTSTKPAPAAGADSASTAAMPSPDTAVENAVMIFNRTVPPLPLRRRPPASQRARARRFRKAPDQRSPAPASASGDQKLSRGSSVMYLRPLCAPNRPLML